ncbi:MAG: Ig-like domain-containing protein [Clostridia bacterium]|nr:Ig-like domain-containing protein [Clostridia bacterium]
MRKVPATGIKLDQTDVEVFYVRKAPAFTLTETVLPEDQLKLDYEVIWSSDNEKVVTVDEDGNVTTHKRGCATITATLVDAEGNVIDTAECSVKVKYTWWQWLIWFFLIGCAWYFV